MLLALFVCLCGTVGAVEPERFAGRTLAEALRMLQQRGLPIVYSSAVVTSAMRVDREPAASDARRVLDELLAPHTLEARQGPGGLLQIVRATRRSPRAGRVAGEDAPASSKPTGSDRQSTAIAPTYRETVVVHAPPYGSEHRDVATDVTLDGRQLVARTTVLTGDALMAMHTTPRVAPTGDFRSDFALRGSGARHLGVVIDGAPAFHLQHGIPSVPNSAALAMIAPAAVDYATVQVGAHPRRFTDTLGGQLTVGIREGSRESFKASGSIGGISAAISAEGPLGSQGRGSWLVSGRHNLLDWPTTSFAAEYAGFGFGFRDLQMKTVYDFDADHQVSLTAVAGQSVADRADEEGPGGLFEARHSASLVSVGWRSTLTRSLVLQQRGYAVAHDLRNTDRFGATLVTGRERGLGYRADLTHVWQAVTLEGGGQVTRLRFSRTDPKADDHARREFQTAGYTHATWKAAPAVTLSSGLRITDSTMSRRACTSPWVAAEWKGRSAWSLAGAAGVGCQLPAPSVSMHIEGSLPVERARYLDVTIERRITPAVHLQATWFDRSERDVLDTVAGAYSLSGASHGAELSLVLAHGARWTGSVAYSFGRTHHTDTATGERFWGDFDQRHAIGAFLSGVFGRTTMTAAFRSGSNFPIAGRFTSRDELLFEGEQRNTVRRPTYARLDLQASRFFPIGKRRLTLFAEVLNVLDRTNYGPANGQILPGGRAIGFSETLLPRFIAAGLRVDFERVTSVQETVNKARSPAGR